MLREKIVFSKWLFWLRATLGFIAYCILLGAVSDADAASADTVAAWQAHAVRMEIKYKLPPRLLRAVCEQESHWRNGLRGAAGEIGICQMQEATVRMICPSCVSNARQRFFLIGSADAQVARIQAELRERGFYLGKIDSAFAQGTRTATILFQQRAGLEADGIVGPRTWAALFAEPYPGASIESALWNPEQNIEWAAKYLAWLQDRVSNDPAVLAAAYNGGPANRTVAYMVSVGAKRQALVPPP